MPSKGVTILGSTGTIGINALKLVEQYPDRFHVVGLTAGKNVQRLAEQIEKFKPLRVAVQQTALVHQLRSLLPKNSPVKIFDGNDGVVAVAAGPEADLVISAIVGFAGVKPTMAAIEAGKDIALANKEAIVAAGPVLLNCLQSTKQKLIPVDSEHSAIFQALHGGDKKERKKLKRIILTASGGPFLHVESQRLKEVTPEQALKHPTWSMGAKITIDSATMMNKGLEVIEATRLFDLTASQVDVIIHPESIVHSLIEYIDASMLAQLGVTDMRGPLAYAMAYPDRLAKALPSLQLARLGKLTFSEPDFEKFPCLRLAYHAAGVGKSMPAVLNAANEVAVEAFLAQRIGYLDIPRVVAAVMEKHKIFDLTNLEEVCETDAWARQEAAQFLKGAENLCQI